MGIKNNQIKIKRIKFTNYVNNKILSNYYHPKMCNLFRNDLEVIIIIVQRYYNHIKILFFLV